MSFQYLGKVHFLKMLSNLADWLSMYILAETQTLHLFQIKTMVALAYNMSEWLRYKHISIKQQSNLHLFVGFMIHVLEGFFRNSSTKRL